MERCGVPRATLELINVRVGQINGCSVCVDMHSRALKKLGESDARSSRSPRGERPPTTRAAERAALALAEAATRLSDRADAVPDEVWKEASGHFSEAELSALVMTIALANLWNRLNVVHAAGDRRLDRTVHLSGRRATESSGRTAQRPSWTAAPPSPIATTPAARGTSPWTSNRTVVSAFQVRPPSRVRHRGAVPRAASPASHPLFASANQMSRRSWRGRGLAGAAQAMPSSLVAIIPSWPTAHQRPPGARWTSASCRPRAPPPSSSPRHRARARIATRGHHTISPEANASRPPCQPARRPVGARSGRRRRCADRCLGTARREAGREAAPRGREVERIDVEAGALRNQLHGAATVARLVRPRSPPSTTHHRRTTTPSRDTHPQVRSALPDRAGVARGNNRLSRA